MKTFSKDKFIEDVKERGIFYTIQTQYALKTWVRRLEGQEVKNGRIGYFKVSDNWCIDTDELCKREDFER
jgi:hypothetical protein